MNVGEYKRTRWVWWEKPREVACHEGLTNIGMGVRTYRGYTWVWGAHGVGLSEDNNPIAQVQQDMNLWREGK